MNPARHDGSLDQAAHNRRVLELSVLVILGAAFGFLVYESYSLRWQAQVFPLIILVLGLALIALRVFQVLRGYAVSSYFEGAADDEVAIWSPLGIRRGLILVLWLVLFSSLVWFVGLIIGLSVGTFLYIRLDAGRSLRMAAVLGGLSFVYLALLLHFGIGMALIGGYVG